MVSLILCFVAVSLSLAKRCDKYVTGNAWWHKQGGTDERDSSLGNGYHGCKKGCFDNNTYTELGSKKCEKCTDIEDQQLCEANALTCFWKKGKCKPTSCPQLAKEGSLRGASFVQQPSGTNPRRKGKLQLAKECMEGTPEEKFNDETDWNRICPSSSCECKTKADGSAFEDDNLVPNNCNSWTTIEFKKKACDAYYHNNSRLDGYKNSWSPPPSPSFFSDGTALANDWQYKGLSDCQYVYETQKQSCYGTGSSIDVRPQYSHSTTILARKACHRIYGCMYSKGNERCSVWATWAFILCVVLAIVVFLVIVAVLCFILLGKLGGKGKKVGAVETSAEVENKDSAPGQSERPVEYAPVESAPAESTSVESVSAESAPTASVPLEESESSEKSQ